MAKIFKWILIVIATIVALGALFYWYDLRPVKARKECNNEAYEKQKTVSDNNIEIYNARYSYCMRGKGFEVR